MSNKTNTVIVTIRYQTKEKENLEYAYLANYDPGTDMNDIVSFHELAFISKHPEAIQFGVWSIYGHNGNEEDRSHDVLLYLNDGKG